MQTEYELVALEIRGTLLKISLADKILQDALAENPRLREIAQEDLQTVIINGLQEIVQLEAIAWRHKRSKLSLSPEAADRIRAIVVLSGPGTWYQARKEDRYKTKAWAAWMDHRRLVHAAWVMRRLMEIKTGKSYCGSLPIREEQVQVTREAISGDGPYFIYTGREDEREAVRRAVQEESLILPLDKVYLIEEPIANTVDQVKTLQLPSGLCLQPGDRIGLVAHSAQLVRIAHMFEQHQPFPPGIELQPFPLPIPKGGWTEYPEQEMRGLLYYTFLTGDAAKTPYPYLLE